MKSDPELQPFDLGVLTDAGLRRGYTTGSCATAAVKAALLALLCNEFPEEVNVTLPDSLRFLTIPIDRVRREAENTAYAEVIKDGGDDPDQTHRARIFARVQRNQQGSIVFQRGEGVGLVTQLGLQVAIGEPAINPVPRQMMITAVHEVLSEGDREANAGFDLQIGCQNGEQIARRTFNPRLGIIGGISILGTTGVVEPKSMAAFQASIQVYIRVAVGDSPDSIVLAPGNLGQRFARSRLGIATKRVVQMSNFIGLSLEYLQQTLEENRQNLPWLWLVGHPGKLAKILVGDWDTHSGRSLSAINSVKQLAHEFGVPPSALDVLGKCRSIEEAIELLPVEILSPAFWTFMEQRIAGVVAPRVPNVERIEVRLFRMDGEELGRSEGAPHMTDDK
ncbi:MAG TPA: cobalt-precorrin-5B (C(1))-methyltransferase CbiD [Chthoniobacterales bacterium]|jgi:cobalt-precorrin-5B (C1)-methyltransferase|nr:cobalt-precorrin-5B (C(1))-methyltransferase CbiD [Chthoniobacterales bacterium]